MEITKKFTFEGSHVVRNCTSERCKNSVHGHSYTVELTLEAKRLDKAQMVLDFGLLKGPVKEFIDSMDHCHLICSRDSEAYRDFFMKHNDRWILLPFNPSAEMLSLFIMRFTQFILEHMEFANGEDAGLKVKSCTVHETATGKATAYEEDIKTIWSDIYWPGIMFSNGVIDDWSKNLKYVLLGGTENEFKIKCAKPIQQINLD